MAATKAAQESFDPKRGGFTSSRVRSFRQSRYNPIDGLTPTVLVNRINQWRYGQLRELALTMEEIAERDDVLSAVIPKRVGAVVRRGWSVVPVPGAPEATVAQHKEALEFFYNNLTATDALERNKKRGASLLIEQMMSAVGMKYAAHHIQWLPTTEGMKARFTFVPTYFFENMDGELKFLPYDLAYYGEVLEPGQWMVTVGQGLMIPSAVAYMYKRLSLTDWVGYNEKFGSPGLLAKSDAAKGSEAWEDMVDTLDAFAAEFAAVIGKDDEITSLDFGQAGNIPFPMMVERMDRALASIWRGADLSTMSAGQGQGQGASLQEQESDLLEQQDGMIVSETLNESVDRAVIAWTFGPTVTPAACLKIVTPKRRDVAIEIEVDKHLLAAGVRLSRAESLERYGRTEAEDEEDALKAPAAPTAAVPGNPEGDLEEPELENGEVPIKVNGKVNGNGQPKELANQLNEGRMFMMAALKEYATAERADLKPLAERIDLILAQQDPQRFVKQVAEFRDALPVLLRRLNAKPKAGGALAKIIGTSYLEGRFN